MVGARLRAALLLGVLVGLGFAATGPARAEPTVHVVETAHYRLHYEGREKDAQEAGRVLEAAWGAFEAWFGRAPKLAKDERLVVRFYAKAEGWAAGIRADGTQVPHGAGGYYWPGTKTAYLYRQPTVYFTRTLLVHEAAHQFHFLTQTRNRNPSAKWYTEGLAEFLSWHRWDGTKLELGVVPGVTLKDYPAKALVELDHEDFDLGAIVSGGKPASRALSWALFCFLATGRDDKPLPRFEAFRKKMDRGGRAKPLFESFFGRPGRLVPKLRSWLEAHQTPWAPVFNEWEQIGSGRFRGYARVVTACRLKGAVQRLRATLEPRGSWYWRAGLLLHWTSKDDYTVAMLTSWGGFRVDRRTGGRWVTLDRARLPERPGRGALKLEARREGDRVGFLLDGRLLGSWKLPGATLGLALERADLRFDQVRWE